MVGKTTSLRKALWASTFIGTIFLSLWFLRFFHILGSRYDLLIRWISTVSLILCGVVIGIAISEKKIRIRGLLTSFLLFAAGFIAAPFVGVGILMLAEALPIGRVNTGMIFGGSIVAYLLLYLGLWFRLKNEGVLKLGLMDETEK